MTALHWAAYNGFREVTTLLLKTRPVADHEDPKTNVMLLELGNFDENVIVQF